MAILLLLVTVSLYGAEVDQFSKRQLLPTIADSLDTLNQMANEHLAQALKEVKVKECEEEHLYNVLKIHFNTAPCWGKLARRIIYGDELEKVRVPLQESIYRDFSFVEAIIIKLLSGLAMSDIIRVGDTYLGIDKLEHLWGQNHGFSYFERYYLKQGSLDEAMALGHSKEHKLFGAWTTGVISYADLSANFNGMRFWNHLLQKREDVLGQNLGPYIACQAGRWVQVKQVDLSHYIDRSFDESINCSRFRNKKLLQKVQKLLSVESEKTGVELTCPISREDIPALEDKYGWWAPYLLNFHGHNSKEDPKWREVYPRPGIMPDQKGFPYISVF